MPTSVSTSSGTGGKTDREHDEVRDGINAKPRSAPSKHVDGVREPDRRSRELASTPCPREPNTIIRGNRTPRRTAPKSRDAAGGREAPWLQAFMRHSVVVSRIRVRVITAPALRDSAQRIASGRSGGARRALEADRRRDEQEFVRAIGRELLERQVLDVEDAVLHHQLLVHGNTSPVRVGRHLVRRRVAARDRDLALHEPTRDLEADAWQRPMLFAALAWSRAAPSRSRRRPRRRA